MYVSVGQDTVVLSRDIVAVCDIDRTSVGRDTKLFLRKAQEEDRIFLATDDIPVTFIVCTDGRVILSQLSTATLLRRMTPIAYGE